MEEKRLRKTASIESLDISDKSREALQSGTWQEVRRALKTEIQHFTEAPEIQHFAVVKVNKNDNVYGVVWGNVVREYLKTAYSGEDTQADVISDGITYKILKREGVTAFYDADGNTLFDVENKRLEKEYGYIMREIEKADGSSKEIENADEAGEKYAHPDLQETDKENVETQEERQEEKTEDEDIAADMVQADTASVKHLAEEKLEKELRDTKDKDFADPVIRFLLKRCAEDAGLAQDVMQEHKTWGKCYQYIFEQAGKQAKNARSAAVRCDVVYEWAEDYYHRDDKAEEEKKAKKAAEHREKEKERKKQEAEQKQTARKNTKEKTRGNTKQDVKKVSKTERKPVESPHPKKNSKEMDGQMDLFSMMGM